MEACKVYKVQKAVLIAIVRVGKASFETGRTVVSAGMKRWSEVAGVVIRYVALKTNPSVTRAGVSGSGCSGHFGAGTGTRYTGACRCAAESVQIDKAGASTNGSASEACKIPTVNKTVILAAVLFVCVVIAGFAILSRAESFASVERAEVAGTVERRPDVASESNPGGARARTGRGECSSDLGAAAAAARYGRARRNAR